MMDRRFFSPEPRQGRSSPAARAGRQTQALPSLLMRPRSLPIHFRHQASRTSQKYLPESMGAGVAMFDYDNNGYQDLFFVNGAKLLDPMPRGASLRQVRSALWNRMYRGITTDGTFTRVTESAGLRCYSTRMGVATGDYDRRMEYSHLLSPNLGGNTLYHNNGKWHGLPDVFPKSGGR